MVLLLLITLSVLTSTYDAIDLYPPYTITAGPTYTAYKFNILQHLTALSPYFETNTNGLSPDPPPGCTVVKAAYLVRHASIYANDYDYEATLYPFLQRLKNASSLENVNFSCASDLAFLTTWTSPITDSKKQVEKLTISGGLEAFHFGTRLAYRYPHLLPTKKTNASVFKVWASKANRTRQSANAFFAGLYGGIQEDTIGQVILIAEGEEQGANTLTPHKSCPRFSDSAGAKEADIWLKYYTGSIIARFAAMGTGFNFSANDVLAMQELCGYETVIRGSSLFCPIFTSDEWLSFEYYFDIKYHYQLGYGADRSPSLGMPWVVASSNLLNEARTTDQDLYISFTHRQKPLLVLTSLGLYNNSCYAGVDDINTTFPLDQINHQRAWRTSELIPVLGHVALERLDCASVTHTGSFVRVLVNSIPKPLPHCASGPAGSCPLPHYMDYVQRRHALYEKFSKTCGVRYKNTTDVLAIYS
ncbi:unnamed protein product [Didymodactylos carnosus]|uniref:Acid phosphatase n=1 Tax=Didymodactylos carnosus TaxID=1234261 RepID=A0A813VPA1_9BILA|nr:unnamed protein product [Didymodactylos carnosus]CAF1007219.1 unnamed protein product [Didymodactylos carnosus]CAF3627728.1 unnamed protein product [Didymodactylos carnosus]CAF3776237.1 unnamed protein product [Didymodactylos carnosus]